MDRSHAPSIPPVAPVVVKVGGSLLHSAADYAAVAAALRPLVAAGPAWIVVSAAKGVTDRLAGLAAGAGEPGDPGDLLATHARLAGAPLPSGLHDAFGAALAAARGGDAAPLLAWGEQASAHILRSRLSGLGVRLPVVELAPSQAPPPAPHAVVPGFFLRDRAGRLRILPRGGSDVSAVLVARWTGGRHVRLWKEGGGLRLEPGVTAERADAAAVLAWLGDRVRPLHPDAVRLAARLGVVLALEDPGGRGGATRIEPGEPGLAAIGATAAPLPPWSLSDAVAEAVGPVLEGATP